MPWPRWRIGPTARAAAKAVARAPVARVAPIGATVGIAHARRVIEDVDELLARRLEAKNAGAAISRRGRPRGTRVVLAATGCGDGCHDTFEHHDIRALGIRERHLDLGADLRK